MAKEITYHCTLNEGIHARPAGHIARLCNTYQCDIVWQNNRTGIVGSAKNALSLVATDTLPGDDCQIIFRGPDSDNAATALEDLFVHLPDVSNVTEPTPGHLPRWLEELNPQHQLGICIHDGIAIAPPAFISGLRFEDLLAQCPQQCQRVEQEQQAFNHALETLRQEKTAALTLTQGIEHDLLEAHLAFITDVEFHSSIDDYLQQGMNGWLAVVHAAMDYSAQLQRSASRYIQQRTLDILDIAIQILRTMDNTHPLLQGIPALTAPAVVFASALTPSQLLAIPREKLAGLVLSHTGQHSHTAILASALGIPTVADIELFSTASAKPHRVILDAGYGILITEVNERLLRGYRQEIAVQRQKKQQHTPRTADRSLLTPALIQWDLDAEDKNETIKKMVDHLWLSQRTTSREKLCRDIWARETPFPTVVGSGFAIPHARTSAVENSTISIARLSQPVAWGGVQVDTVFMLSISESAAENEHMRYFSTLARMLMNDEFVAKAQATTSPNALYDLIFSTLAL
ncbi:PTS sugar transporter subunit IIA [Kluyvera genomosp. 1]|uniref:PTS sugar transporter subunit IIA n=1 Tax=Kluyvera genomosp. 1 TaxID=2774053 RepID=UPI00068F5B3A|nr:PTS sugar transporter subunit IIA [Kluyvera genomosp. 1]